jgi:hypothetical protein
MNPDYLRRREEEERKTSEARAALTRYVNLRAEDIMAERKRRQAAEGRGEVDPDGPAVGLSGNATAERGVRSTDG